MLLRYGVLTALVSFVLAAAWSLHAPAAGDEAAKTARKDNADEPKSPKKDAAEKKESPRKTAMKTFMRKKLEAAQNLLEGLAVEDFDMITSGARQLKTTSAAAEFMVINDPMYSQEADEFRRIVDKLAKAAKEKRLDGAALAYVDMTMSCIECHKYVRNVLVAEK
jgi:hypothetical protein